jgi:hypothetical protein
MLILERLENVVTTGDRTVAACPACRAGGHDRTGNHLVIFSNGKFGCVGFPGRSPEAVEHRRVIAGLAGDGTAAELVETPPEAFLKLPTTSKTQKIVILGRFGRSSQTLTHTQARADTHVLRSSELPSEPSERVPGFISGMPDYPAPPHDPDDMDCASRERLRLIENILALRDGKGRVAYTASQIDGCIIGLRGFAQEHPQNAKMLARLRDARRESLTAGEVAERLAKGHRA